MTLNNNFDHTLFRPNILIDTDSHPQLKEYYEDEIMYIKLSDSVYLRFIGPCKRCKACTIDWDSMKRDDDMEPY